MACLTNRNRYLKLENSYWRHKRQEDFLIERGKINRKFNLSSFGRDSSWATMSLSVLNIPLSLPENYVSKVTHYLKKHIHKGSSISTIILMFNLNIDYSLKKGYMYGFTIYIYITINWHL